MTRRTGLAAVLGATLISALGAGSVLGGEPRDGSCPATFTLQPVSYLYQFRVGGLQSADLNGNGQTCVRLLATPSDIVFMDDVVKPS